MNLASFLTGKNQQYLNELERKIPTGNAVLFTGAGFSKTAKNIEGSNLMVAKTLANHIASILNYSDESDPDSVNDLSYMSDLLIDTPDKIPTFIEKMNHLFCVTETSIYQNNICQLPWKRFYTTNYDDSIQQACKNSNKKVYTLKKSNKYNGYPEPYVMHINGHIDDLNEDTIRSDFKLTATSYISIDNFIHTPWGALFSRDIQYAQAFVFVGYSLYDFEIEKVLVENNQNSKERIYFITKPDITNRDRRRLEKYGKVIDIGIEGFSSWIEQKVDHLEKEDLADEIKCLDLYTLKNNDKYSINDSDILNFLMYGTVTQEYLEYALRNNSSRKALIYRDELDFMIDKIRNGHNIVITSELGNGKSICLESLAILITRDLGSSVYFLPENLTEFDDPYSDLDLLKKSDKTIYLFIENCGQHGEIIKYIQTKDIKNIKIVTTIRTALYEKNSHYVENFIDVNLDLLSDNENKQMIELIDYIGYWADLIRKPTYSNKLLFIKDKNNSMISSVLLSLLKSQNIKDKIQEIVSQLFEITEFKDIVFSICLLSLLGRPSDEYIISKMINNQIIYGSKLKYDDKFKQLFKFDPIRRTYSAHSSVFSQVFISNYYDPGYIIQKLIYIVKNLDVYENSDKNIVDIKTQILRFSFIERVIPERNKKSNLNRYYDLLKQEISWIKYDPHYWLQYAMAQITLNDYRKAQTYLSHAYKLAENKIEYKTHYIDTQQARLYLKKSLEEIDSFNWFSKGHLLLMKVPNDISRYKQQNVYEEFYNNKYKTLSKGNKVQFEYSCKEALKDIEEFKKDGNWNPHADKIITILKKIISSIEFNRV
ncbi:SIR2 family protein [Ignatzschineria cameli]|uniref:Uncharacterized protein n=1 Tax=Ignatzschineria cameli TaxID=2182793 RepID=A0A2U2ASN5_9GAMM|nr:SIR2 family protein [Ignatzschineria cameli]PWD86039.1 hypothetical protein DC080_04595 [Ignatzschineria cameli]PWD87749.1 hypothetical protein DC077_00225 [Ignatzschineria cameli]